MKDDEASPADAAARDTAGPSGERDPSGRTTSGPPRALFESSWSTAWDDLGVAPPSRRLRDELLQRYLEPQRRYHTQQHLAECLALFEQHRGLARRPGEVALALWFHDAIYETTRGGNELASADWAREALRAEGVSAAAAQRVHDLVMATRHDQIPTLPDACLLVDIDLAILGAPHARFDEYEAQIRAEYAHVPEVLFRTKRGEILQSFLDRPVIYATPALREALEVGARANLRQKK